MSRLDELMRWDPAQEDLPEHLARALDTDPALRAAFDARFAPAALTDPTLPDDLADRVGPIVDERAGGLRLAGLGVGLGALAAGSVLALVGLAGWPDEAPEEQAVADLAVDEVLVPARGGVASSAMPEPVAAAMAPAAEDLPGEEEREGLSALEALGYVEGGGGGAPAEATPYNEITVYRGSQRQTVQYRNLDGDGHGDPAGSQAGTPRDEARELFLFRSMQAKLGGTSGGNASGALLTENDMAEYRDIAARLAAWEAANGPIGDGARLRGTDRRAAPAAEPKAAATDPSGGETYTHHGTNPRVLAADDPLSTFAVDVDTGSWTVVRRKLREGFLPPPAAVRVEEAVNWFRYADPAPTGRVPFEVTTEAAVAPWDPSAHVVRIGLQGRKPTGSRPPVHLVFLVDTSGSMSWDDKLGLVKKGLVLLTSQLRDGDTVAIVAYAGSAGLVLPPTGPARSSAILQAIEGLESGGSTAMGTGIQLAYDLAEQMLPKGGTHRVILLSDGDANVGATTHGPLVDSIRRYAQQGIALTTVGVGTGNYRDTMMERLADEGDGQYVYLDGMDEARRVFVEQFAATAQVLARDVKIQVAWDPSVVNWYRLVGYENRDIADRDFRNDAVDAGELGMGHHVTAVYEVGLVGGAAGSLGTVRLRWKAPGPDAPAAEHAWPVDVRPSTPFASASADTRLAVTVAAFAEKLRGGPMAAELAWPSLVRWAGTLASSGNEDAAELAELVELAAARSE
ncbi:MAG: von Willebrand factor type A domain-containing protein [Alphaproteobacteria bacterium]|nr:von Willebrand factor type A domain-containing protein [Alphaproteobacteria bacterium]